MSTSGIMGVDQTAVVAAGATATVVLVSGLLYYYKNNSKPDSPPSRTGNEKKESKSKLKKKSSGRKKASVKKAEPEPEPEEVEVVEEEVEQEQPQEEPAPQSLPSRRRKKGKGTKVEAAAPAAAASEPAPAPAKPVPPAVAKPEPAPVAEPEPEPEPAPAAGSKKSKKKKNKAAKGGGASTPAAADDSAALAQAAGFAEAEEDGAAAAAAAAAAAEAAAWTTVKAKRLPKSVLAAREAAVAAEAAAAEAAGEPQFVSVADLEAGQVGVEEGTNGASSPPAVPHVTLDLGIFASVVIGKSGATIKDITEKSGAKIKVGGKKGEPDAGSSVCVITGEEEAVVAAEALIREILDREQAIKDKTMEITMEVGSKMPAVMGKQGANIKKIVQESGATIDRVPSSDNLTISGFAEQVAAAKALVELYMAGGPPPEAREEVELGSERARFVVLGPKGTTIKALQDETGAKVILEHGKSYAVVEGDAVSVAAAVSQLKQLLDENSVVERIDAKNSAGGRSHLPAIIGKGGSVIKGLRERSGASIDLVSTSNMVKVTGTREQVAKAKAAILAIIAEEETPAYAKLGKGEVCEELTMPLAAVGMVIGRMGLQIKQIKDESGANVLVPKVKDPGSGEAEGTEPTTTAKVFGPKAGVAKALELLKEIVKRHEERAARDKANGKKPPRTGGGGGNDQADGSVSFFGDTDKGGDAANPAKDEAEISFEVALDKDDSGTAPADADAAGGWDATASSPPGIGAAPGWS